MSQPKNRDDIFVNLAITVGPRFLQEKKPGTNQEIAEILNSYAGHYSGVLREVFTMLAKYYTHLPLTPLREFPLLSADAPPSKGLECLQDRVFAVPAGRMAITPLSMAMNSVPNVPNRPLEGGV